MMRRPLLLSLAALLVPAYPSYAAFSSPHELLLPVASAGAGGIGVANPGLGDAMVHNPAVLAAAQRWQLASAAGSLAERQAGIAGISVALPVDGSLGFGLAWNTLSDWEFGNYAEQSYGAAAAVTFGRFFTAGAKANYHLLNADGLGNPIQGMGVDLGVYSNLGQFGRLPGRWVAGGALINAVAEWPDPNVRRSVPVISKAALAWVSSRWELGVEHHWVHAAQLPDDGYAAWRAGGELRLPWSSSLRAGFAGGTSNQATFGAGKAFDSVGANLDYALVTDVGTLAVSHRLGLSMKFGSKRRVEEREPAAEPMQLIMEPGSRRVRMARLAMAVNTNENVEKWTLEIRNKKGDLIRTLEGTGTPPVDLVWDGLDAQGNPVDADDVYYQLSIKTPQGVRRGEIINLAAAGTFDNAELKIPGYELPEEGPRAIPVLSGRQGSSLRRLTIDFTGLDYENVAGWKLVIADKGSRPVKVYRGRGDLPENLVWDGRDPNEDKVRDPLGLTMEFSYTDADGENYAIRKPVFSQETYEAALAEIQGRPTFRLIGYHGVYDTGMEASAANLRLSIPKGRAMATVNTGSKRRRTIPRGFFGVDPVRMPDAKPKSKDRP